MRGFVSNLLRFGLWGIAALLAVWVFEVLPISMSSVASWALGFLSWLVSPLVWPARLAAAPEMWLLTPVVVLVMLMAPLIGVAVRQRRRRRAVAVLGHVEMAVRLNLPLERMLEAAAQQEGGAIQRRLRRLHGLIDRGRPLGDVLVEVLPELSRRDRAWLAAGGELNERGAINEALGRVVQRQRAAFAQVRPMQSFYHWYPLILLAVLGAVWGALAVFVYPKLVLILGDFNVNIPALTAWSMRLVPWIWVAFWAVLLGWVGRMIWRRMRRGTGIGIVDLAAWAIPWTRRMAVSRGMEDVCRWVASALEAGWGVDRALTAAAELPGNRVLRRRIRRWGEAVGSGQALAEAAQASGVDRLTWGMLKVSERTGATARTLEFLATAHAARYGRALILLQGAYVPAVVLAMGVVVGTLSLGLMLPLEALYHVMEGGW